MLWSFGAQTKHIPQRTSFSKLNRKYQRRRLARRSVLLFTRQGGLHLLERIQIFLQTADVLLHFRD